jgi:hypothetical protein
LVDRLAILTAGAILLAGWGRQWFLTRGLAPGDGGYYVSVGEAFSREGMGAISTPCQAPGLSVLLGGTIAAGASVMTAFRLWALIGYLSLAAAVFAFTRMVTRRSGASSRQARYGGLIVAVFFSLSSDSLRYGGTPLTDHFSVAALLVSLVLMPDAGASAWRGLVLGALVAFAYLMRYVTLPLGVVILATAVVTALRRGADAPLRLARAGVVLAPPALVVILLTLWLSPLAGRLSYGANSQLHMNAVLTEWRSATIPGLNGVRSLNPDATMGLYHASPHHPGLWDWPARLCEHALRVEPAGASPAALALRQPVRTAVSALRGFHGSAHPYSDLAVGVGLLSLVLLTLKTLRAELVSASLCTGVVLSGGILTYFGESRYLWLPLTASLASLPAAWAWCGTRLEQVAGPTARRWRVARTAIAGVLSVWGVTIVESALSEKDSGILSARAARLASQQAELTRIIQRLVAPTEALAAARPAHCVAANRRWFPSPQVPVRATDWRAASDADRRAALRRVAHVLSEVRVRWLIVLEPDVAIDPPSGTLLSAAAGDLPPGLRLVAAVPGGGPTAWGRIFEVHPQ